MAISKTSEIILGRVEHINASHFNCLSFAKASDMANGINVRLSNMAGGYPFSFGGVTWHDSETLYNVIIIEDTTKQHGDTKEIWGCTNTELAIRRAEVKKKVTRQAKTDNPQISKAALKRFVNIEICKVNCSGMFVGQNNLGKILMICRDCLSCGMEPQIDYNLLESKDIHILGKRISFIH